MSTSPLVGMSYHICGSHLRLSFSRVCHVGVARQCGNRARLQGK